jgi:hypothetical protein
MEFNFRDAYQSYSNVELLKIVHQPERYQPEAVAAAQQVLSTREVHDSDYDEVNNYKVTMAAQLQDKQAFNDNLSEFLESLVKPEKNLKIGKWLNILLVVIALQYIWLVARTAEPMINYLACETCSLFSPWFLYAVFQILYIPVIGYLLFRRRRWGWILLLANNIAALIFLVINTSYYFRYRDVIPPSSQMNYFQLITSFLIKGGFILFLWIPEIAAYFNISSRAKRDTVVITICITLTFFFAVDVYPHLSDYFNR